MRARRTAPQRPFGLLVGVHLWSVVAGIEVPGRVNTRPGPAADVGAESARPCPEGWQLGAPQGGTCFSGSCHYTWGLRAPGGQLVVGRHSVPQKIIIYIDVYLSLSIYNYIYIYKHI